MNNNDWNTIDELQYKDEVTERLINTIEEYMSFSTTKDLLKLIANNV